MASNCFGTVFKIATWGESHGPAVGVVIDGCPAGLALQKEEIDAALFKRAPGNSLYTSPRKERDEVEILSGVFHGQTTGAPIALLINNRDARSSVYAPIQHLLRPGHANYTYLQKYGLFDDRGGGRASARETACRVAAGAVAKKLLQAAEIEVGAYLKQVGPVSATVNAVGNLSDFKAICALAEQSGLFCPDKEAAYAIEQLLTAIKEEGDSLGGVVEFITSSLPVGLGDPIYEKLEAKLAHAMMSLPASKGFEMGEGFLAAAMRGSEHNDLFSLQEGKVVTQSNHSGGTLAGISTGMPLIGRVAFKPTSSIQKKMATLTQSLKPACLQLPPGSRHDPCVAIRAVPVVEAMLALVLADAYLLNRLSKV